jgi:hypothetical protein
MEEAEEGKGGKTGSQENGVKGYGHAWEGKFITLYVGLWMALWVAARPACIAGVKKREVI